MLMCDAPQWYYDLHIKKPSNPGEISLYVFVSNKGSLHQAV